MKFFVFSILLIVSSQQAFALSCQHVKQLVNVYFKMHFSYNEFSDELSRRTLSNFIKSLDPGKMFFLKADVDKFELQYGNKIDDLVGKTDCKFVDDIVGVYSTRFEERQKPIEGFIQLKHDYKVDEYLEFDRKKTPFATSTEELDERWRKRVKFQALQLKDSIKDAEKLKEKLKKKYVLARKQHNEMTKKDIFGIFLNAFASSLDPHSDYMPPDALEDFNINTRLSLEGIGAVLRSEEGFTKIQSMVPGGAASISKKLKVEDKIIAVAQGKDPPVDVIDMDLREVVKLIRGKRGTEVKLIIMREEKGKSEQQEVVLIREKVRLTDRAAKSKIIKVEGKIGKDKKELKIGVINLPSFYIDFKGRQNREKDFKSSSVDMLREIEALNKKKIDGLVVDLRNNGGGSLDESINVAGLFVAKGPVVQTKSADGNTFVQADKNAVIAYDGPLTVLINRQSASASEIFAGAIQDYGKGLIIGDTHTFGKGTVQNLNDLPDDLGAVKITIAKFYRPGGASTQLKGVESDIVLPDLMDEIEIGEKFYDFALPFEKIKETDYKPFNRVTKYVSQLKEVSKKRAETDPLFKTVFEDIKTYKEGEKDRYRISLREKTAAEKEKDAKAKEKLSAQKIESDEAEGSEMELKLSSDAHLQEAARITADFAELSKGLPLLTEMTLPDAKVSVKKPIKAKKSKVLIKKVEPVEKKAEPVEKKETK